MGFFKKLFSRKASSVAPLISMNNLNRPVYTSNNYTAMAESGYKKNVVAFEAINRVSEGAGQVSWAAYRKDSQGKRIELFDHPLTKLMMNPNPFQGKAEFMTYCMGYYMISGNLYVEAVRVDGVPKELYPLRPDRVQVVAGKYGPAGYVYSVGGGSPKTWDANQITGACDVMHMRTFNPTNDWYGIGRLEAALKSIDIRNSADDWNKALLDNSAQPSGALYYEPKEGPQTLTEEQYERLKNELAENTGSKNIRKPLLLEGGLKWVQMSLNPADMDHLESRHSTSRDIALAFGVPPMLVGIPGDNTYCLPFNSRVSTPTGPVKIGEIKEGDEVYSFDGTEVVTRKVTKSGKTGEKQVFSVVFSDRVLVATSNHPVLVDMDTMTFVPVGDLSPGDLCVCDTACYLPILRIVPGDVVPVYDIEVEGTHNFIAEGVVVHNSNYQEARLALWEDTIVPLLGQFRDKLNNWLVPMFGGDVFVDYDIDEIPAIYDRRNQVWDRIQSSTFLTTNEKREALNYSLVEEGDEILVPTGFAPLSEVVEGSEPDLSDLDEESADKVKRILGL